jgi:hypothetical protein
VRGTREPMPCADLDAELEHRLPVAVLEILRAQPEAMHAQQQIAP